MLAIRGCGHIFGLMRFFFERGVGLLLFVVVVVVVMLKT